MLFNSWEFLLVFLPLSFSGFFLLARANRRIAGGWLFIASLAFYGWWEPKHVLLLLASIAFNFTVGSAISSAHAAGAMARAKRLLWLGIVADLALLGWFKYANFVVNSANAVGDFGWQLEHIVLPLGVSFFTFTQIAFLVDAYRGEVKEGIRCITACS